MEFSCAGRFADGDCSSTNFPGEMLILKRLSRFVLDGVLEEQPLLGNQSVLNSIDWRSLF